MEDSVKILVTGYNGRIECEIPEFSKLKGIIVTMVSGDSIITPVYKNGRVGKTIDPHSKTRTIHYYDGMLFIKAKDIDKYNQYCHYEYSAYNNADDFGFEILD